METKVIHIKSAPTGFKQNPLYVYIGRPGPYGNPILLHDSHNDKERADCLAAYRLYVEAKGKEWRNEIRRKLRGKILVCFCKPKDCHGDELKRIADSEYE